MLHSRRAYIPLEEIKPAPLNIFNNKGSDYLKVEQRIELKAAK